MHQPYPGMQDAMHCAGELARSWRAGTLLTDRAATAKCCYTIVGFGLGATFGEPESPLIGVALAGVEAPLDEPALMAQLQDFATTQPEVMQAKMIPWPLIVDAVLLLIQRLRKN